MLGTPRTKHSNKSIRLVENRADRTAKTHLPVVGVAQEGKGKSENSVLGFAGGKTI